VEKLLGAGVLFQVAVSALVGVRLLRLAARTRQVPELALGSAYVLLGTLGHPLAILARSGALAPGASAPLLAAALAAQDLACLGVYVMTWRTFRPAQRALGALVAAVGLGMAVSVALGAQDGFAASDAGAGYWLGLALRAGAFLWAACESLRQHSLLRRRLRLRLADPVVTDRFWLWSLANLALCVGFAVFALARLAQTGSATSPVALAVTSAIGVLSGGATWLAFLPPARYLRHVAARSQAA
jgi:hypothetical protein